MKFTSAATIIAAFLPLSAFAKSGGESCSCEGFEYIDFVQAPGVGDRRALLDAPAEAESSAQKLRATGDESAITTAGGDRMLSGSGRRRLDIFPPEGGLTPPQWFQYVASGLPFLDNCILAPIESQADIFAISQLRFDVFGDIRTEQILVGVHKDPSLAGECPNEDLEFCRSDWLNFDGSEVPDTEDIWGPESNTRPNDVSNFAFLQQGTIIIVGTKATKTYDYAVVKCCLGGPVCYDTAQDTPMYV